MTQKERKQIIKTLQSKWKKFQRKRNSKLFDHTQEGFLTILERENMLNKMFEICNA